MPLAVPPALPNPPLEGQLLNLHELTAARRPARATDSVSNALAPMTALYLMLPALLFAIGWLTPPIAILVASLITLSACACVGDLYHHLHRLRPSAAFAAHSPPLQVAAVAGACLVITLWVSLCGAGGVGYQNADYQGHNALLRDLIMQPWPLRMNVAETVTPIVYYVGYYLPAAVAGKVAGWYAANAVMFLWTVLGALLAFAWFVRLASVPRGNWLATAVMFCFAGGLDVVGSYLLAQHAFELTRHVDSWAGYFQYSSNTTLVYWVPQHAIAAWLVTGLVVYSARDPNSARVVAVSVASALLWSPFAVLGIIPFSILAAARWSRRKLWMWLISPSALLMEGTAVAVAAVHLAYLAASRFAFPVGFVWEGQARERVLRSLLAFWVLEFGALATLLAVFVVLGVRKARSRGIKAGVASVGWLEWATRLFGVDRWQVAMFGASVSVLTLLPMCKVGHFNNLVTRSSIPALFVLWTCVVAILSRADLQVRRSLSGLYCAIVFVVVIGGVSAVAGMSRSIEHYRFGPPRIDSVKTTALLPARIVAERSGRVDSLFFRLLAR